MNKRPQDNSLYEIQHDSFGHHIDHSPPSNVEIRVNE